jgi:hypothetical protein
MGQTAPVDVGERQAGDVEDEGSVFCHSVAFCSTTTKLAA